MHAKMTRDRKKNFIATIEKTIEELERDCERMRDVLNKVGAHEEAAAAVLTAPAEQAAGTSTVTPVIAPLASPNLSVTAAVPVANKPKEDLEGKYPSSFSLAAPASTAPSVDHLLTPKTIQEHHEPALKAEPFPEYPEKHAKVTHGFSWAAWESTNLSCWSSSTRISLKAICCPTIPPPTGFQCWRVSYHFPIVN